MWKKSGFSGLFFLKRCLDLGCYCSMPRMEHFIFWQDLWTQSRQTPPAAAPLFSSAGPRPPHSPLPPPRPAPRHHLRGGHFGGRRSEPEGAGWGPGRSGCWQRRGGRRRARAGAAASRGSQPSPCRTSTATPSPTRTSTTPSRWGTARGGPLAMLRGSGGARAALVGDGESRLASWGRPVSSSALQLRAYKSRFKHF